MEKRAKPIDFGSRIKKRLTAKTLESCSDAGLMALLGRGEMDALGVLYMRYGKMVASAVAASAPMLPRQEVEDLSQDVFLTVSKCSGAYREKGKFRSWLYSIAVRTAKRRRRMIRVRKQLLSENGGRAFGVSGGTPAPEDRVAVRMDLLTAFKELSDIQRQLLVLFEYQGMSGEDIAALLDMKLNTVWSHLRRARSAVLSALNREPLKNGRLYGEIK